jgi:hypothetical protein
VRKYKNLCYIEQHDMTCAEKGRSVFFGRREYNPMLAEHSKTLLIEMSSKKWILIMPILNNMTK